MATKEQIFADLDKEFGFKPLVSKEQIFADLDKEFGFTPSQPTYTIEPSRLQQPVNPPFQGDAGTVRSPRPVNLGIAGVAPGSPETLPEPEPAIKEKKPGLAKETVAFTRGLVSNVPTTSVGLFTFPARVIMGAGAAYENFINSGGDPEQIVTGFREGYKGERGIFGKSANWWDETARESKEIIAGKPGTKEEELQHVIADQVITALWVTYGGANVSKLLPQAKKSAGNILSKAKKSLKTYRELELKPQELQNVKMAHQGAGGKMVESLSPREREFLDVLMKEAGNVRAHSLRTGTYTTDELVYPWQKIKPKDIKVVPKKGQTLLPSPQGEMQRYGEIAPVGAKPIVEEPVQVASKQQVILTPEEQQFTEIVKQKPKGTPLPGLPTAETVQEAQQPVVLPALEQTKEPSAILSRGSLKSKEMPKTNYRVNLGELTDNLYHETSPENAISLLPTSSIMEDYTRQQIWYSNNPDLALGQKGKKGVVVLFDPNKIEGKINTTKPTSEFMWSNGNAEFYSDDNPQETYQNAAIGVVLKKDVQISKTYQRRMLSALQELEKQGWIKTELPNGDIFYHKPKEVSDAEGIRTEAQKTGEETGIEGREGERIRVRDDKTSGKKEEKVTPVLTGKEGKAIAEKLGVAYKGIQLGGDGKPLFYDFRDIETNSDFYGKNFEEAKIDLENTRKSFEKDQVKSQQKEPVEAAKPEPIAGKSVESVEPVSRETVEQEESVEESEYDPTEKYSKVDAPPKLDDDARTFLAKAQAMAKKQQKQGVVLGYAGSKNKKLGENFTNDIEKAYQRIKTGTYAIRKLQKDIEKETGVKLPPEDNLVYKINAVHGAGGTAKYYVDAFIEPVFKNIRKSLKGKRISIGQTAQRLNDYLIAKRVIDLHDMKSDYDNKRYSLDWAQKYVTEIESSANEVDQTIRKNAQQIWDYTKKMRELKREYWVISHGLLESLEKEQHYVPFFEKMEDVESFPNIQAGQRFTTTTKGIKKIKGSKSGREIDVYTNLVRYTNETVTNALRNDVFRTVVKIAENSKNLSKIIKKVKKDWKYAGTIDHRIEIDKVLSPQIDAMVAKLGGTQKAKIRTGKKLGSFTPSTDEITMMFGATEASKAHELGHLIDIDVMSLRKLITLHPDEMKAVADTRHDNINTSAEYLKYVRSPEEEVAEFVSMYITDRPRLSLIAPNAVTKFEAMIQGHSVLKELKDMLPTRQKDIKTMMEDNFVLDNSIPLDDDVVSGFIDGKLESYQVPMELAIAMKNLFPEQIPIALKLLTFGTPLIKAGAVGFNLSFAIPNIVVDQIDAAIKSKSIPGVSYLSGLYSYVTQDELYKQWLLRGGAMDAPEAGVTQIKKTADRLIYGSKGGKFLDPFYWKKHGVIRGTLDLTGYGAGAPFRFVRSIIELSEISSRLGVLKRHLKSGDDILESIHRSRNATLDYQNIGSKMKSVELLYPFINAALESMDQLRITARREPGRLALKAFGYVIGPTIAIYMWNRRFPKYKDIPEKEKERNHIWFDENGKTYSKIPKSHISQLIGNPIQFAWEMAEGNTTMKPTDIPFRVLSYISPFDEWGSIIPHTVRLFIEPFANYDFYWQEDIEKPYERDAVQKRGERHKSYTSQTLRTIGRALNISPIMMQHQINTMFGGSGKQTLYAVDVILGLAKIQTMPELKANRIPVLTRFRGNAEEWKSDITKELKDIDKRLDRMSRVSVVTLIKYNGYTREEAARVMKQNVEVKRMLLRKKMELIQGRKSSGDLLENIKKMLRKLGGSND